MRAGGDALAIGIEITESVIMEDIETTVAKLRALREDSPPASLRSDAELPDQPTGPAS